MVENIRKHL